MLGECCCLWLSRYFCQWRDLVDALCRYTNAQWVREEAKGQRKIFMCKFFLSCHKILILFHNFPLLIFNLLIESIRQSNIWSLDARVVAHLPLIIMSLSAGSQ